MGAFFISKEFYHFSKALEAPKNLPNFAAIITNWMIPGQSQ